MGFASDNSVDNWILARPIFPFLVSTRMTPKAALAPYTAAAEASFSTLTLAMSLGLIRSISIGTPSTRISGEPPLIDSYPRILKSADRGRISVPDGNIQIGDQALQPLPYTGDGPVFQSITPDGRNGSSKIYLLLGTIPHHNQFFQQF